MIQKMLFVFLISLTSFAFAATADLSNPQGAVWNLREAGFVVEAQALEDQLIEILRTAEINAVAPLTSRTSTGFLVRFPGGIYAVMKLDDPEVKVSHRYDVAAFLADRKIALNMVPITIAREIHGKNYSLQLYYPQWQDASTARTETEFATPRYWDLVAFDDFIANVDRELQRLHNVIIGVDGRLVAIDHARTFRLDRYQRIQNGVYLDKTSQAFRKGFMQAMTQDFAQGFEGLLVKDQIQALLEKRTEMSRELKTRPQVGSPVPQEKPQLPREFSVPAELQDKVFADLFAVRVLLGSDSKKHPQAEINKVIESSGDSVLVQKQAVDFWDYFSIETRARILPLFFETKDFAFDHSEFLQKVLMLNPEFVFSMMAHDEFRRASFPHITRGLSRGNPETSMSPEIRQVLRQHLVQGQLINRAGFDFDELFRSANEDMQKTLLREIYQDLVKNGLQDHVARIFRLQHLKNASLPPRIIAAFPLKERALVQAQLIRSYKMMMPAGTFDPKNQSMKAIGNLIHDMRGIPLSTPMCEGLF